MILCNDEPTVVNTILDSPEVAKLVTLVEEAARSTEEGASDLLSRPRAPFVERPTKDNA